MAINKLSDITTPNPVSGDWEKMSIILFKGFQNINSPLQVDGSNIPQGALFQSGGVIYHADTDTAITGTSSDYVKLTVSGDTLVPSFASGLTGVSWNKIYNGYYDVSGSLYIFDEAIAIYSGALSVAYSKFGEMGALLKNEVNTINSSIQTAKTGGSLHKASPTYGDYYDLISPIIPNVGDKCHLSGYSANLIISGTRKIINQYNWSQAIRASSTTITMYACYDGYDFFSDTELFDTDETPKTSGYTRNVQSGGVTSFEAYVSLSAGPLFID